MGCLRRGPVSFLRRSKFCLLIGQCEPSCCSNRRFCELRRLLRYHCDILVVVLKPGVDQAPAANLGHPGSPTGGGRPRSGAAVISGEGLDGMSQRKAVVIVGAGPVGLVAAAELVRRGV